MVLQALDATYQAFIGNRLEQIIHRSLLEGLYGMLVIGGDEHHAATGRRRTRCLQTGFARHANVEKSKIRLDFGQGRLGRHAVMHHGNDLQFRP